jgi:GntR family transcriptional regulator/MocR family aminotransferase
MILSDWLQERLDKQSGPPLYRQLHNLLLAAVLDGQLPAGTKLPASRLLARELGIARNTVIEVYENLRAQGCVEGRHGSGTYVADLSVDHIIEVPRPAADTPARHAASNVRPVLSKRGQSLIAGAGFSPRQWGAFMPGVPDVREFPARVWTRLQNRHWRKAIPEQLSYAPEGGLPALRRALAEYLRSARSVRCEPEQIIITTGIHQSIDLTTRLLADPGDSVWLEDPCYWGLRSTLRSLGMVLQPLPVDAEGLDWQAAGTSPAPRFVIATPSHQYPLGMGMSLARRQALLEYCRLNGSWIIEDDYDSEFRYGTRPIASLQGLDSNELVIYIGSFSKTLFPGLRLGYLVAPPQLAGTFSKGSAELYREGQLQQQAVLADFITDGHLSAHIRRMRGLYSRRRQCLLEAVQAAFGEKFEVVGNNAGLHLVVRLPDEVDDVAVAEAALQQGVLVRPLSRYYHQFATGQRGLLLGYACVTEAEITPAFAILAGVLKYFTTAQVLRALP